MPRVEAARMKQTPENRSMPFEEWPEADRLAWLKATAPTNPFDDTVGYARRWSDATRKSLITEYGFWLTFLARQGRLDHASQPTERASRSALSAYLLCLRERDLADFTVAGRIRSLGTMLRAIASDRDWDWVVRAGDRLHGKALPKRDQRALMRPSHEMLNLGLSLMQSEKGEGLKGGSYRALRFRDGLLIAFLTFCPLRRRNLCNLEIGQHIQMRADKWLIVIPDNETKTGTATTCALPDVLVDPFNVYLSLHRETLLGCGADSKCDTQALWISRQGKPLTSQGVYEAVCKRTAAEFGLANFPHSFRGIAATTIATYAPGDATAIMDVLGHRSMRPSERYYNRAENLSAGERVQATVAAMRAKAEGPDFRVA